MGLLDSLFGSSNSSTATSTNQQVGAQDTAGIVLGAITTKGGSISQKPTTTASPLRGSASAKASVHPSAEQQGATSNSASTNSSAASGNVNLQLSTTSTDQGAVAAGTQVALAGLTTGVVTTQNALAANNAVNQQAITTELKAMEDALSVVALNNSQAFSVASQGLQASQNLAAFALNPASAQAAVVPTTITADSLPNGAYTGSFDSGVSTGGVRTGTLLLPVWLSGLWHCYCGRARNPNKAKLSRCN